MGPRAGIRGRGGGGVQIRAVGGVQKKAAKFAYHTNESNWETFSQRRNISRICALLKAYPGERAWKAIGDRLQRLNCLSRVGLELENLEQEAKDGYREIFLCEQNLPSMEPVTCRNF